MPLLHLRPSGSTNTPLSLFCDGMYCWAQDLPLMVVNIPNENPLEKINFFFATR